MGTISAFVALSYYIQPCRATPLRLFSPSCRCFVVVLFEREINLSFVLWFLKNNVMFIPREWKYLFSFRKEYQVVLRNFESYHGTPSTIRNIILLQSAVNYKTRIWHIRFRPILPFFLKSLWHVQIAKIPFRIHENFLLDFLKALWLVQYCDSLCS